MAQRSKKNDNSKSRLDPMIVVALIGLIGPSLLAYSPVHYWRNGWLPRHPMRAHCNMPPMALRPLGITSRSIKQ